MRITMTQVNGQCQGIRKRNNEESLWLYISMSLELPPTPTLDDAQACNLVRCDAMRCDV